MLALGSEGKHISQVDKKKGRSLAGFLIGIVGFAQKPYSVLV